MISIIVSSYNPINFKNFEDNVRETIGSAFEIIKIENKNEMGICKAYNLGAQQATYHHLCFCHEDILFHTANWGEKLVGLFTKNSTIGLVGLAGSRYKPFIPSGWSFPQQSDLISMNVVQNDPKLESLPQLQKKSVADLSFTDVSTVDGCFLATTKDIWKMHPFDENSFNNYHCYDLDCSLTVGKTHRVVVANHILISHASSGGFNKAWLDDTYRLHKKWSGDLPRIVGKISLTEQKNQELGAYKFLMLKTFQLKHKQFSLLWVMLQTKTVKILGLKNWTVYLLKTIYHIIRNHSS